MKLVNESFEYKKSLKKIFVLSFDFVSLCYWNKKNDLREGDHLVVLYY